MDIIEVDADNEDDKENDTSHLKHPPQQGSSSSSSSVDQQRGTERNEESVQATLDIPDDPCSLSREELLIYTAPELQLMCQRLGLKRTGSKKKLVDSILGPQVRLSTIY